MARYTVSVNTPKSVEEAFAFVGDLSHFEDWDPGVVRSSQTDGDGPGLGARYEVEVSSVGGTMTLVYEITDFDEPSRVVAEASSSTLTSVDTITVVPDGAGAVVTYDAQLTLNGIWKVGEPFLGLAFKRIGDRAATGLIEALEGTRVAG